MSLLETVGVEIAFGDRHVLRGCDLIIAPGERVGLVGANGSGKSTLLRIMGGALAPDLGTVRRKGTVALLDQDPAMPGETVGASAEAAVAWHSALLADYQRAAAGADTEATARLHDRLDRVGWTVDHQVSAVLQRVAAPPLDRPSAALSGGERRRVALALTLLAQPDVLLLDEPTNHLDADTIDWLEGFLANTQAAVVLVTHDRYLLEAVATRIVEVEDGQCVSYDGSYADYLLARAERQAQLHASQERRLDFIAREAEWASRSPAARSTKQKARLKRLDDLKSTRKLKLDQPFELDLKSGVEPGGILLELHDVHKGYAGTPLMAGLNLSLGGKERLGVLGPNGAGKSTLLRLIQAQEPPDKGEVVRGARLAIGVLDQERSGLDLDDTVFEAAGGGGSHVFVGDNPVHVASFLNRFLFTREFLDQRVGALSGGERARLLLARLLLTGANVLLLDEPTNDLDLTTLRVLEEALLAYDGAAVIVTHDRAFLDRVCTSVLAFEGPDPDTGLPRVVRYASRGQHAAAMRLLEARRAELTEAATDGPPKAEVERARKQAQRSASRKLSWKERKELEALPARIEALEAEHARLGVAMADPDTYRDGERVREVQTELAAVEADTAAAYARWEELEGRDT